MIDVHEVVKAGAIDVHGGVALSKWKSDTWWQARGKTRSLWCMWERLGDGMGCMLRGQIECSTCREESGSERRLREKR
jgi:hypothetical protein